MDPKLQEKLTTIINPKTGKSRALSTTKNYLYNLNKLSRVFNTGEAINPENMDFLLHSDTINKYVIATYSMLSSKNYLNAIIAVLQVQNNDKFTDAIYEYTLQLNMLTDDIIATTEIQTKTPHQVANWTSIKELQKVTATYSKYLREKGAYKKQYTDLTFKEKKFMQYWLISSLYVSSPDNPPVRATYARMRIVTDKEYKTMPADELKSNYLVIAPKNKKYFSFSTFKNVDSFGLKQVQIGKQLNRVLNAYFKLFTEQPTHLLNTLSGTPMKEEALSAIISKIFEPTGKHITLNLLRHIFVSDFLEADKFIEEKKQVADKMMHSTATQELYRKK